MNSTPNPSTRPPNRREVIKLARDADVRFVRFVFADIFGVSKNVSIPAERLEDALEGRITFDGGSIDGFVRGEELDMVLRPDPATFAIYPWRGAPEGREGRLICDIAMPDGTPFEGCPRTTLRRAIERADGIARACRPASRSSSISSNAGSTATARRRLVFRLLGKRSRRRGAQCDGGRIARQWAYRSRRRITSTARASTRSTSHTTIRWRLPTTYSRSARSPSTSPPISTSTRRSCQSRSKNAPAAAFMPIFDCRRIATRTLTLRRWWIARARPGDDRHLQSDG